MVARESTEASSASASGEKPGPGVPSGTGGFRPGAGRKIQKKMPVIWEDGSISRPVARGSRASQPPPAFGPITSQLPLSRGADGLATVATTAIQEFWEKFHHYHRLQAELEKLYLWFEDFEQGLGHDNQELARILSGARGAFSSPLPPKNAAARGGRHAHRRDPATRTDTAEAASAESATVPASSR
ncbi:MAG: hypothetical protein ACYCZN_15225 [Candidatus Dormibacteria bacterium]